MTTVRTERYQPIRSQDVARQRLAASQQEIILLAHLLQAALVVERSNPLRRAVTMHPQLARNVTAIIVILLSIAAGLLAPQISHALWIY